MRSLNGAANSQARFSQKNSRSSSVLEIDFWMPSEVQAISPLVARQGNIHRRDGPRKWIRRRKDWG
jgi:hypothetical protein